MKNLFIIGILCMSIGIILKLSTITFDDVLTTMKWLKDAFQKADIYLLVGAASLLICAIRVAFSFGDNKEWQLELSKHKEKNN